MRLQRQGISTAVIAIVVVIIIVAAGAGVFLATRSSTSTGSQTTTTTSPTTTSTSSSSSATSSTAGSASTGNNSAVLAQINLFVQAFNDRQVESLANFYTSSSIDNWIGTTEGLGGVYTGQGSIRILYSASIGHTTVFDAKISKLSMVTLPSGFVNATYAMNLLGASPALGNITASVNVEQQWENQGGRGTSIPSFGTTRLLPRQIP